MQNRHHHDSSHLRLFEASMIIGISCLFAVILFLPVQPSAAQEVGESLPQPLSDFDVGQYQRLFHLQEVGRMKQAVREAGRVKNDILIGHLLSKRYLHPTAWRSTYKPVSYTHLTLPTTTIV